MVRPAVDQNVSEHVVRARAEADESQMTFGSRRGERRRERRRIREMDGLHARAPTLTKANTKLSGSTPGWRARRSKRSAALTVPFAFTAIHWLGYLWKKISRLTLIRSHLVFCGVIICSSSTMNYEFLNTIYFILHG